MGSSGELVARLEFVSKIGTFLPIAGANSIKICVSVRMVKQTNLEPQAS
ncbi:UNVERIFIED_ORG: hypothetical protein M2435_006923 [Rhizobium sophorae]|nr:hypothetical protein [Rhizobium leguminosarum]MDH6663976.1 hypothetical protein [Rhizobium sophorae]